MARSRIQGPDNPLLGNGNGNGLPGNALAGGMAGVNGNDMAPSPGANGLRKARFAADNSVDIERLGPIDRGDTPFHFEHNRAKAIYKKMQEVRRQADHVRVEMDKLVTLGDTVSPEDVIAASRTGCRRGGSRASWRTCRRRRGRGCGAGGVADAAGCGSVAAGGAHRPGEAHRAGPDGGECVPGARG